MLRRSCDRLGFTSKAFGIGTNGQKHQVFAPAPFLYRFVGRQHGRGIANQKFFGPKLSTYWWRSGNMPSGMEVPFRLDEFHEYYVKEHVPVEVEEWLRFMVEDPVDQLVPNLAKFREELEATPLPRQRSWRKAELTNVSKMMAPLTKAMNVCCAEVPAIAIRGVSQHEDLKEAVLDTAFELEQEVTVSGCTFIRRWSRNHLEAERLETGISPPEIEAEPTQRQIPSGASSQVEEGVLTARNTGEEGLNPAVTRAFAVPAETAPDEKLVVKMLSLFAEGASRMNKHDTATELLESARYFAHDNETTAALHCNLATAKTKVGDFGAAVELAKDAVVRSRSPRAFANLAVATVMQDKHDEALKIVSQGLELHPAAPELLQVQQSLYKALGGKESVPPAAQGKRKFQLRSQLMAGVEAASYKAFRHEFDLSWSAKQKSRKVSKWIDAHSTDERHTTRKMSHLGGYHYSTQGNGPSTSG